MSLQEILLTDDIVKSINDNMTDLLLIIPEILVEIITVFGFNYIY